METLLPEPARPILDAERALLARLRDLLRQAGDTAAAQQVESVIAHLGDLFLLVVVGEFNAGKSSVVNALFGEKLMEEGPIPTTAKITVLRYGPEKLERQRTAYLVERFVPSELLRHLSLVDTPGTNSIVEEHQRLTEDFIPRADLVLFVTSYDRPLTQSEGQFLTFIRGKWGKGIAVVINKSDLAKSESDLSAVVAHVRKGVEEKLGLTPEVFPVSAELAYDSKQVSSQQARDELTRTSRFAPFERYVRETLAGPEQLRIKLGGPLDAATALLRGLEPALEARRAALARDDEHLAALSAHLAATHAALRDAAARPLAEIDALLDDMETRGVRFLQDAFRVTRIALLRDRDKFKEEFNRQVVRDLDRQIEGHVAAGVDVMLTRALTLWQQALDGLRRAAPELTPGQTGPGFDRGAAFDALSREAARRLSAHDLREEARRLLENARNSADLFQYAGAGAAGLGVVSGVLIAATSLDMLGGFGLVTAGVAGALGLTVLPAQRRRAVSEFSTRMDTLRQDVGRALEEQFSAQASAIIDRTRETIEPYTRQVEAEQKAVETLEKGKKALEADIVLLREQVSTVAG